MAKHTTEGEDSSDQYSIIASAPQSIGVTCKRWKNLLNTEWKKQDKHTYSAFLSRDKDRATTKREADVNVNVRRHRPRSAPIRIDPEPKPKRTIKGRPSNGNGKQLLNIHDKELRQELWVRCVTVPPT